MHPTVHISACSNMQMSFQKLDAISLSDQVYLSEVGVPRSAPHRQQLAWQILSFLLLLLQPSLSAGKDHAAPS